MNESTSSGLSDLFGAALRTMEANQQAVNDLDGYNGNHGDNMVQNLRTITDALSDYDKAPPSEALRHASHELAARGKGGTSPYYVQGLDQAAERLEGHSELSRGDVMTLVQSLLSTVPSEGHPQQMETGGSVFEQVLGLAGSQAPPGGGGAPGSPLEGFLSGQQSQGSQGSLEVALGSLLGAEAPQGDADAPASPLAGFLDGEQPQGNQEALGGLLGALLGGQTPQGSGDAPGSPLGALLGTEQPQGGGSGLGGVLGALLGGQPSGQPPQTGQQQENRLGNLIQALLPAAMAFLQAKQSGAEMPAAMGQALMTLLANRRMNPLQAGTPRSAAGGLVAQSILQALAE